MTVPPISLEKAHAVLAPHGLSVRAILNLDPEGGDAARAKATVRPVSSDPDTGGFPVASILLIGHIGSAHWPAFCRWQAQQPDGGGPDPLDQWSKQVIGALAKTVDAVAWYPSDRPWQPFQQWVMQAEGLRPSPLGILIHPEYGLWHGYRGALGFRHPLPTGTSPAAGPHPCDHCPDMPCIPACPVGAISAQGFDIATCRNFLRRPQGTASCMHHGCLSRRACPVGARYRYDDTQARFHMAALSL